MKQFRQWQGMTLIELMVTIGIIGLLLVIATPSLNAMQTRQSLRTAQRGVQSALYRLEQLTLAPQIADQTAAGESYDVIGYGLLFYNQTAGTAVSPRIMECSLAPTPTNDFLAVIKIVRLRDSSGSIQARWNGGESSCANNKTLNPKDYVQDFYLLPRGVTFYSETLPEGSGWLITRPLYAVGQSLGAWTHPDYPDPLMNQASHQFLLRAGKNQSLCMGVTLARETSAIAISPGLVSREGCL